MLPASPTSAAVGVDKLIDSPAVDSFPEPLDERLRLVDGLRAGDEQAAAELYDRYHVHVRRLLMRVIGTSPELSDVVQDAFLRAFRNAHKLRSPEALTSWMTRIATFTAIDHLRARQRRRWLRFVAPESLPEVKLEGIDEEAQETLRRVYVALDQLPVKERVAFALRKMHGLELTDVAENCGCSLATAKRRVRRAESRFLEIAREDPLLARRLGDDWEGVQP